MYTGKKAKMFLSPHLTQQLLVVLENYFQVLFQIRDNNFPCSADSLTVTIIIKIVLVLWKESIL